MKQFAVILLLASGFALQAEAQSFLNELEKKKSGQGTVTVTQSKDIDELVNNAKLIKASPSATQQGDKNEKDTSGNKSVSSYEQGRKAPARDTLKDIPHTAKDTGTSTESPSVNTTKKVMRNSRKVTGYRVQAYSGGNSRADRQKAENIGSAIKMRFPDLPVYVHFYSPRWICRVGNFRTYQEASNVLKEIKGMGYRQACIVKGKITVGY